MVRRGVTYVLPPRSYRTLYTAIFYFNKLSLVARLESSRAWLATPIAIGGKKGVYISK